VSDVRAHLLPVYVVVDESDSMRPWLGELNTGLASLHNALLAEPMAAAKVRFTILGFSDTVEVRMRLADLRRRERLPELFTRHRTSYRAVFADLLERIPDDVYTLKGTGYAVYRPAVFFLSDGQPSGDEPWRDLHGQLTDRVANRMAPNIIACGIGRARAETILAVATQPKYAFLSVPGTGVGEAVARFCTALTKSVVESGRSVANGRPALVVERPEGFRMAIDVI
jgi:uncharacterized protein YegL